MTRIHKKRKNFEFKLSIRLITKKKQSTTNEQQANQKTSFILSQKKKKNLLFSLCKVSHSNL